MAVAEPGMPAMMSGSEDLDATVVRRLEEISEAVKVKKPSVPPWLVPLVMYLIGHLVGSVWWAATMQSRLAYSEQRNVELWQLNESNRLKIDNLKSELDEKIRGKVRETMDDFGYLRVRPGSREGER